MKLVCLAGVLFLLVLSSTAFAVCSTGAWSSVTGTPLPLGESTSPVGKKFEQSCGLTVDATDVPAYVTTDAPIDERVFYARFYLLASELSITGGYVTLLTARDGSTTEVELRLRESGGVNYLVALYRTSGVLTEHPNPIALEDVWHGVEVSWSTGAGDGTFDLRINDFPKYHRTNLVNGSAVINEMDLGVVNAASATGEVVFDAFDLRRNSSPGLLTINEMFGISTRADVRSGDLIVIGGFIITGDTDKCIVIRGRGPSLPDVDVPPELKLSNPKIDLYEGPSVKASNDDWQDSPGFQTIADLGLAPGNELDAAMYICLAPGAYTVHLTNVDPGTGIGIVEVFDGDEGTPYLWAISTRSVVDTGDLVAIGGFIVDGNLSKHILVRGRGPSVDVPTELRLSDPELTLYNSAGTPILVNDDWGDAPNAADVTASGYAPSESKDSAILMTLDPGAYTAILRGIGGATGIGIVEVLDLSGGTVAAQ